MKQGVLIDHGYGETHESSWMAGAPERSIWFGLKTRGRTKFKVVAYRCEKCGLLKSYATKAES
jgi:hypothetical protein